MFSKSTYITRRSALLNSMKKRGQTGIILLMGNSEVARNYPSNGYPMRQDSSFLYYFGLSRHDLAATIDIESGETTIFGDDYTLDDFIWMGVQPSVAAQSAEVGVEKSADYSSLTIFITKSNSQKRTIHFLPPYRAANKQRIADMLGISYHNVLQNASEELIKSVVENREIKSEEEIMEMHRASDIGNAMHREAMRLCRIGATEREIAGAMEGITLQYGAGVSFHSIVSQNGQTLHNHDHSGIITDGRLLLVDAGAESVLNYCSDNTRTLPSSGKFTPKQRDIYNIVYNAIKCGLSSVREGVTYQSVQKKVALGMIEELIQLGLMKGNAQDALEAGAVAMLMPHGLGHQIGLDVHDMEDLGERFVGYNEVVERSTTPGLSSLRMGKELFAGHCITVEPGIYFVPALIDKWQSDGLCTDFINYDKVREYLDFGGIRLENSIVVTKDGMVELGAQRPPLTINEVEDFMRI